MQKIVLPTLAVLMISFGYLPASADDISLGERAELTKWRECFADKKSDCGDSRPQTYDLLKDPGRCGPSYIEPKVVIDDDVVKEMYSKLHNESFIGGMDQVFEGISNVCEHGSPYREAVSSGVRTVHFVRTDKLYQKDAYSPEVWPMSLKGTELVVGVKHGNYNTADTTSEFLMTHLK